MGDGCIEILGNRKFLFLFLFLGGTEDRSITELKYYLKLFFGTNFG